MAAAWIETLYFVSLLMCTTVSLDEDGVKLHNYDLNFINLAISGALANSNTTWPIESSMRLVRLRRQSSPYMDKNVRGFSTVEKQILVNRHNEMRSIPQSSDMNFMYWDSALEALAQKWAENCDFSHNPSRKSIGVLGPGPFAYVGENLFAGTGGYDPARAVKAWYDEVEYYNYATMACSGVCGHYTQVVWATSYALGCGVVYCPVLKQVNFGHGWHIVCNYGPGGNYRNEHPYKTGERNSQCEQEAIFRVNKLCAKYPVIGASSAVVTRSRDLLLMLLIGNLISMTSVFNISK